MRNASFFFLGFVLLGSSIARSQERTDLPDDYAAPVAPSPELAQPASAAPTRPPPAPPLQPPPPPTAAEDDYLVPVPSDDAQAAAPQGPSDGQWVYTDQYGWVFMPYGDQYVDEADASDETPFAFVYCPGNGWSWVAAPWLWGWGAYPYFGVLGPSHFGWFRGLYTSGYGWGGYRGGGSHSTVRRLGSNGYSGGGGANVAPTPGPAETRYPGAHHGGYAGGYWHNYPMGGNPRGNGSVGGNASSVTAGRAPSSSGLAGAGSVHGGATTGGPGSHGGVPAGSGVGANHGDVSAHHGGLTSGMRGGSSGGGRGSSDDHGRQR